MHKNRREVAKLERILGAPKTPSASFPACESKMPKSEGEMKIENHFEISKTEERYNTNGNVVRIG